MAQPEGPFPKLGTCVCVCRSTAGAHGFVCAHLHPCTTRGLCTAGCTAPVSLQRTSQGPSRPTCRCTHPSMQTHNPSTSLQTAPQLLLQPPAHASSQETALCPS